MSNSAVTRQLGFVVCAAALCLPASGRDLPSPVKSNLELARQLNQAFVEVAEQVSPAVVVITVLQKPGASSNADSGDAADGADDPIQGAPPGLRRYLSDRQEKTPQHVTSQGSGIILRADGYILTNRHVVEDAERIEVRLKDGRTFKAEVRGVDAPADVAVIKINARNLPVARLADSSKTRVGEFAIAIGAPFSLDYSVTFGHVSAKDRSNVLPDAAENPTMMDQNFIQTDANINPGNSGGPLVNIDGEVIGINTLIRGLHTGIGFAIPINLAKEVADKLISDGKFTRVWLGVVIASLREYSADLRDLLPVGRDGVVVEQIGSGTPAAKSGLLPADLITAIDGIPVVTSQQLKNEIRSKQVGHEVALDVYRQTREGAKTLKINVKPVEWVDKAAAADAAAAIASNAAARGTLGMNVKALTVETAREFGVESTEGVIVTHVDGSSLAAREGDIKSGDIITSINRQPISNPRQFRDAVKTADLKKGVLLTLVSEGTARFEILKEEMP